jgi:hypothetical protein
MDTANELRTLLTGGTNALSILTTSDNIGINWADVDNPTNATGLTGTTLAAVTVSSFTSAGQVDIQEAITGQGYSTTRAGYMDKLNSLTFTVANKIDANVYTWNGTAVATPGTAGIPDINVLNWKNSAAQAMTGDAYAYLASTATPARMNKLDYLDAAISTRGTSTLTAANVWETNISAYSGAGYAGTYLKYNYDNFVSTWTATLAPKLLYLDAAITSRGTSTYAGADTAGTTTLLSRLSAARAGYLDYLVDISTGVTRLDADYTTARAASITAIETDTSAMDSSTELRTLLTGADVAVSTTTAASIWANGERTLTSAGAGGATAKEVWDYAISAYNVDGSAGGYLVNASTKTAGTGATAQQVWEYATRTLSAFSFNVTVDSTTAACQNDFKSVLNNQGVNTTRMAYVDKLNVTGTLANTDNAASFKATGFSTHSAADVAALILATPAQKLVTDSSGRVTVGSNADKTGYTASTVSDKTGYSLSQAFPTNFSSMAIDGTGKVTAEVSVAVDAEDIQAGLNANGYTAARAVYLDTIPTISTKLDLVTTYTNGTKDTGVWNGIESLIRGAR